MGLNLSEWQKFCSVREFQTPSIVESLGSMKGIYSVLAFFHEYPFTGYSICFYHLTLHVQRG